MGVPFREIWGFLLVGVLGVIADIGTFTALVMVGAHPLPASLAGFALGVVTSFLGNKAVTFRHRSAPHLGRAWGMFIAINAFAVAFISLAVWVGVLLDLELGVLNLVRTAAIGLATVVRFFAYRRWVFIGS